MLSHVTLRTETDISIFHQARNKWQCCLEFRVMFRAELHMFFPTTFSKVTQITYRARIMYKATKKADGDKCKCFYPSGCMRRIR